MSPWFPTIGSGPSWGIVASGAVALSGLCLRRLTRNVIPCLIVGIAGMWAMETIVTSAWQPVTGPIQRFAWSCAAMALWWSIVGACDTRITNGSLGRAAGSSRLALLARVAALLLGVTAAMILATILTMQGIYVLVDLVRGYPVSRFRDFGFGERGLGAIGFLTLAAAVSSWSTRDHRLPACLMLGVTASSTWTILLLPVYHFRPTGGYERTPTLLLLGLAFSAILVATAVIARRRACRATTSVPGAVPSVPHYPGLNTGATALSALCVAIMSYHLLVPIVINPGGARLAAGIIAVSGAMATFGSAVMLRLRWSPYLADAVLSLASLTLCAAMTMLIPETPTPLADRYPMIFCAIMFGLVAAAGGCAYGGDWLASRHKTDTPHPTEENIRSWLKRFAFFNAAMALVAGVMMSIWPKLPNIATMDDSLGRVAAGTAANLALVLVSIWCSRRVQRGSFHALTVLAILATGAFVVIRVLPFASGVG